MDNSYDWKVQREKKAFLALEDGTIFHGYSVGASVDQLGEVVFNTGLSGYQEVLSDPSYAGQLVSMTYPEIGNYGINNADMESRGIFLSGFIVHNLNEPSNWRSEKSLSDYLKEVGIPAIAGIDTRALTIKLRQSGTLKGFIHCSTEPLTDSEGVERAKQWVGLDGQDYASKVSCTEAYQWDPQGSFSSSWGISDFLPPPDMKIVAYDFGIKYNILRSFRGIGVDVTVVPAQTSAEDVLKLNPRGIFFSNGPADPAALSYAIKNASIFLEREIPMMGICLGHQLLSLAAGAKTYRLKFGHHGCNHPVKNLKNGTIEITSQNHNFAVDPLSIPDCLTVTHINLNDQTVEGIQHKTKPMFAVQYHPESAPGPHDPFYLFAEFRRLIENV